MLFNSVKFLAFFPLVTLLYFIVPKRVRYIWLLFASYFFYMSWNPKYALLLIISTLITYAGGLLIGRAEKIAAGGGPRQQAALRQKKIWVALSFISNLAILGFFKYFDFAVDVINNILRVTGFELLQPSFDIILPIGISFYTFQALSYTVDVYRGKVGPEKNLARYALFVSFFPQILAGPIERSTNMLAQFREPHTFDYERVKSGLMLMMWGFFQKMVIADRIVILVDQVFNNYQQYAGLEIALAVVLYAVQIYCDFAGYSNVAIGAAEVLGFKLMENFRQPYLAASVKEFWRRWHISLSSWFKDYLYIPLGGSRKGKFRTYVNTMIVFLVSGLWHGASWNFVVWGGLHGSFQVFGAITKPARDKIKAWLHINENCASYRWFQRIITFILVDTAWIFFRAKGTRAALLTIQRMFSEFNPWIFFDNSIYNLGLSSRDFWLMVVCIAALCVIDYLRTQMRLREFISRQNLVFRWLLYYAAIFAIIIFGVFGKGYSAAQFIYFQF